MSRSDIFSTLAPTDFALHANSLTMRVTNFHPWRRTIFFFLKWATPPTGMSLKHWIKCQPSTFADLLTELKYWINVRIFSSGWRLIFFSCHVIYKHANLCSVVLKVGPTPMSQPSFLSVCLIQRHRIFIYLFQLNWNRSSNDYRLLYAWVCNTGQDHTH